jgi:CzcA family heavy metal efflux pump
VLSRIVRASIHHPRLIATACVVLLACGVGLLPRARLDSLPNLTPAQASIETEAPGMVAEQVEALVTRPIENALIGTRGVATVRSRSIQGLSVVTLDFAGDADPLRVRQAISEGLAQDAGALPAGVGPPRLAPLISNGGDILAVGFTSDKLTPMALRDAVQWSVRPRLLSVPGVARAQVFGGEVKRIEVRARAGDLSDSDLGYADVFAAVRRATGVTGAGFIDTPNQRIPIVPQGQALTDDDVAAGQIQVVGSAPTRISDVADVVDAPAPSFGDALVMGKPGVVLGLAAQYGANTLATTKAIDAALASLTPALEKQGITVRTDLYRPASFVGGSVRAIVWELAVGVVLASVLLALWFRDPRAALVSIAAIPLSLMAALAVIAALGWTINAMTLGGLAVALGLIVDDAVLDVENILSDLRDAEARHASRAHAILMASLEVRAPVIYATLLVIAAVAPVMFLDGPVGALLRPMAVSLAAASVASLLVAIVITPAMAMLFLDHVRPAAPPRFLVRLEESYERLLGRLGGASMALFGLSLAALAITVIALALFRVQFPPKSHGDYLVAEVDAPAATSLAVMRDYGARISQGLLALPGVATVAQEIGRADGGDDAFGPQHARFDIGMKPTLSTGAREEIERDTRALLQGYPGLAPSVHANLAAAVPGRGRAGAVRVRVFGNDLDAVESTANKVAAVVAATPGAHNVTPANSSAAPVMRVDLNFQRLAIYGLSAADVLDIVQTAFEGRTAAQVYEDGRAVDIAVTAQADLRTDPEGVGGLLLRSSSGVSAPLRSVANIYLTDGRSVIEHEGGQRSAIVTVDPSGDAGAFAQRLRQRIDAGVSRPPGVYIEVLAPEGAAEGGLIVAGVLSALAVFALLLIAVGDLRAALIVLVSTLFAFIGAAAVVAMMGGVLSLGAFMGFVALLGLSARNGILLISRADTLAAEGQAWEPATVWRAARERLSAILITALLVALALAPFAVRAGAPGHEIIGPMVLVILGGLLTATPMALFVTPLLVVRARR